MKHKANIRIFSAVVVLFTSLLFAGNVLAHCDTMAGPVVKAAQEALRTGNVNLVLIWVQKIDEAEVRGKFQQALAVRKLNRRARELADNYFFETIVRLHRAGEGEPYTGLKPLGTDLGPVIPVADKSLAAGSADKLLKLFPAVTHPDIEARFQQALRQRRFRTNDLEAGRAYVKAYITFMHYVEALHEQKAEVRRTELVTKRMKMNPSLLAFAYEEVMPKGRGDITLLGLSARISQ